MTEQNWSLKRRFAIAGLFAVVGAAMPFGVNYSLLPDYSVDQTLDTVIAGKVRSAAEIAIENQIAAVRSGSGPTRAFSIQAQGSIDLAEARTEAEEQVRTSRENLNYFTKVEAGVLAPLLFMVGFALSSNRSRREEDATPQPNP